MKKLCKYIHLGVDMILYKTKLSFNKEINFFAKNPVASNSSFIFFFRLTDPSDALAPTLSPR